MKRMRRRLQQQPLQEERERRKPVFKTDPNPILAVSVAEVTTPQVVSSVIL